MSIDKFPGSTAAFNSLKSESGRNSIADQIGATRPGDAQRFRDEFMKIFNPECSRDEYVKSTSRNEVEINKTNGALTIT